MLETPESWGRIPTRKRAAVEILERLAMACQREGLLSCSLEAGRLKLQGREGGELLLDLDRLYTMNRFDLVQFPEALYVERPP